MPEVLSWLFGFRQTTGLLWALVSPLSTMPSYLPLAGSKLKGEFLHTALSLLEEEGSSVVA